MSNPSILNRMLQIIFNSTSSPIINMEYKKANNLNNNSTKFPSNSFIHIPSRTNKLMKIPMEARTINIAVLIVRLHQLRLVLLLKKCKILILQPKLMKRS